MVRRVRAGQLRNKISVEVKTPGRDTFGGTTESWAALLSMWCKVEPISGTERLGDDSITGDSIFMFTGRVDPSKTKINTGMRINWDSRIFDIESVQEIEERGWWLKITATERKV